MFLASRLRFSASVAPLRIKQANLFGFTSAGGRRTIGGMTSRRCLALSCTLALAACSLFAADIPKPLKSRFVVGDPVWREIPIRDNLRTQPEKCWQVAVSTILDNNFDIATMDKDSGYIRTTWNEGVVVLGGNWNYKVQISIKLVPVPVDPKASGSASLVLDKIRVQATGEIAQVKFGTLKTYFRGYDQILLQNLFQDLQAKIGSH